MVCTVRGKGRPAVEKSNKPLRKNRKKMYAAAVPLLHRFLWANSMRQQSMAW